MAKKGLTQLGRAVAIPRSPDEARIESVPNPHADTDYVVRFTAPRSRSHPVLGSGSPLSVTSA